MYQSDSFYIHEQDNLHIFMPSVTSTFKILADKEYFHRCDDEEKLCHAEKTISFIRCTEGSGKIYLNDRMLILKENECVFLKFHNIKEYGTYSNIWGYRWINFTADNIASEFDFNKIYNIPFSENEDKAFQKLLINSKFHLNKQGYINSLFLSYFYSIMLETQFTDEDLLQSSNIRLIDDMCSYIHQKLYSKVTIDEIASFFKISPRRLHQIFTKELCISPKQYILKKKMEEGYRLLVQTSSPVNKIADMLCFSSPYHFSNEFKKIFGQTPSEVRKM